MVDKTGMVMQCHAFCLTLQVRRKRINGRVEKPLPKTMKVKAAGLQVAPSDSVSLARKSQGHWPTYAQ